MLRIQGLEKSFGDKAVLRGVDLAVPEGSIFGFIGKNGSGKTTTMKCVLGLVMPDAGKITVCGEDVRYGETSSNRYIGYMPDVPEMYSFMSGGEYLRFCGEISGMSRADAEARCTELMCLVGLKDDSHRIKGYSRGMKQRLAIAAALFARPRLLICDEPTSALDPDGRSEILDLLLAVKGETTVLFSTHILSDVERICTDVAFLDGGRISLCGRLADIKSSFRRDEYELVLERVGDAETLLSRFPRMKNAGNGRLQFSEGEQDPHEVLKFLSEGEIPLLSFCRLEPTLEALYSEVIGK